MPVFQLPQGVGEQVRDGQLLILQAGPLASELELLVADFRELLAEAERHAQLEAELPFLILAIQQRGVGVASLEGEYAAAMGIDQRVARAKEAIEAHGIQ